LKLVFKLSYYLPLNLQKGQKISGKNIYTTEQHRAVKSKSHSYQRKPHKRETTKSSERKSRYAQDNGNDSQKLPVTSELAAIIYLLPPC
jgi:hypothetical protein